MRARASELIGLCNILIIKCFYKGRGFDLSFMKRRLVR